MATESRTAEFPQLSVKGSDSISLLNSLVLSLLTARDKLRLVSPRREPRRPVDVIKRSTVSTAPLRASRPLHARPINLVVFQGSFACATKPHLEGGFPLRCFQRLSLPNVATLRWT